MTVDFYCMSVSAPCRTVHMLNPQHNIPVIKDGKLVLNESRAIAMYLANVYGQQSNIYPKDAKIRAVVDQRLYFDAGVFYKAFGDCVVSPRDAIDPGPSSPLEFSNQFQFPAMHEKKEIPQSAYDHAKEVLGWANDMVKPTGFVAGTTYLTLADIAFLASYSTMVETGALDLSPFPELKTWYEKAKGLVKNYEKANGEGAAGFGAWYKQSTSS
eukprot:maker-scaffold14_size734282-snap-gene-3.13 protein:Tk11299 transcript:maker-scaffold14_size734282-snap-gene-3.13-mRNA-1 annotation:"glutathione s-transferase delta-epsilon 2"